MKTRILLATLGVSALTAFAASAAAGDALLSPRAAANQIKSVPGDTETATAANAQTGSPRGLANQVKTVKGMANDRNPYLECRKMMTGSPKAVQACSEHWPNMRCGGAAKVAALK